MGTDSAHIYRRFACKHGDRLQTIQDSWYWDVVETSAASERGLKMHLRGFL